MSLGKKIAIVGTGAQGASIGADMIRGGLDVTFIEQWPAHVEAMRANGVRINMPGETQTTQVRAFHLCEVAELRETFDIVFIVVKAYDTRWACELIKPLVSPTGLVTGVQNGMTMDAIAAIMGAERTLGAVIEVTSNMFEPGVVNRQTPPAGSWFCVGGQDAVAHGRAAEVAEALRHSGKVEITNDIRSAKWMKLVVNSAEFLASAILNLPLADAIKVPGIREIMAESGTEAIRTGLALGYQLTPILGIGRVEANDPDQYAAALFDAVLNGWTLPDTKVAVLQDWQKGRRGEVDDINGLVVQAQNEIGGQAPVNAGLVKIAHRIESGELKADPSNADMLVSLVRG